MTLSVKPSLSFFCDYCVLHKIILHMVKKILWKFNLHIVNIDWVGHVKDWNYSEMNGWNPTLMLVILIIRFWDFSRDSTERVTDSYIIIPLLVDIVPYM